MADKAPGQLLKERYIPIEDVQEVCGITLEKAQYLIDNKIIRYAEFFKPGAYKRSIHVDPVEIQAYLDKRG